MTARSFAWLCGLTCLAAALAGCGHGPKLYPVSGTVTYQGKAVDGAVLSFRSDDAKTIATATTDAQGRFELTTYQQGKGAVAGKHKVTVRKFSGGGAAGQSSSMEDMVKKPQAQAESKNILPAKYADDAKPLLEYTVNAGGKNDFQIELKD